MADAYKYSHHKLYYPGTTEVYSYLESRGGKFNNTVFFGLQYFIKEYLINQFDSLFFQQPKDKVLKAYARRIDNYLGKDSITYKHISDLYDLGYLPLEIKALPEGSKVPMRVPCLTIVNTLPEFYWITNFLETILSAIIWQPCTSATIAYQYRKILNRYAEETGVPMEFVQ